MLKATTVHVATARHGVTRVEICMLRVIAVTVASTFASSATIEELDADNAPQPLRPVLDATIEEDSDWVAHVLVNGGQKAISLLESLLASLDVLLSEFGLPATAVMCAALAIVMAFLLIRKSVGFGGRIGAGSAKRRNVLFLGPCGSGKTAMMHKLCHDRLVTTVTSMQSCRYTYKVDPRVQNGASTPLIDFPGHERLRGGVEEELRMAERVVFVIDGSSLMTQIAAGAELLYDILCDPSMEGCRGLLVALNKSDLKEIKPARAKTLLQKELEKLRSTRGTLGTQGEEDDLSMVHTLGRHGQPVNLEVDSPCDLQISTCSVKAGVLQCVEDFIRASAR